MGINTESVKDSIGIVYLNPDIAKYKMKESIRLDINNYHSVIAYQIYNGIDRHKNTLKHGRYI